MLFRSVGRTSEVELSAHVLTRAGTTPVIADASTLNAGTGLDSAQAGDSGRSLSVTPAAGFTGQTSLTLTVADGTGSDALSSTITLPVLVVSTTNTPPVITPTEVTVAPGEPTVGAIRSREGDGRWHVGNACRVYVPSCRRLRGGCHDR